MANFVRPFAQSCVCVLLLGYPGGVEAVLPSVRGKGSVLCQVPLLGSDAAKDRASWHVGAGSRVMHHTGISMSPSTAKKKSTNAVFQSVAGRKPVIWQTNKDI